MKTCMLLNKDGVNSEEKLFLLLLMCMLCLVGYAKPSKMDSITPKVNAIEQRISTDEQEIALVKKELELCEKEIAAVNEHVYRANEAVANQIAASSHTIQVWGIVIAILAFVFGFYVNRMWKQMEEAMGSAKMLQQLHADIQNNLQTIYAKLRREDTISLLKRLVDVPEDITNISRILLARTLEKEDFTILLEAYHNLIIRSAELSGETDVVKLRLKNSDFVNWEAAYALQFAQHFMDKAVIVPDIRTIVQPRFKVLFNECFFRNDAEKSTIDFKQGVSSLGEGVQAELLADYIKAMSQSPYAIFRDWYKLLLSNLSERQLSEIWDKVSAQDKRVISFAQCLKDVIKDINPQSPLLEKITAYMDKETETKQNQ